MLLLKYLLLLTGWGLLAAAAVNVFRNLYQVVQYHRQLRHLAPPSASISDGNPAGTPSTHGAPVEKPHLTWTRAKGGFRAAWSALLLAAGKGVVSGRRAARNAPLAVVQFNSGFSTGAPWVDGVPAGFPSDMEADGGAKWRNWR